MENGEWSMAYGVWSMEYGVWRMAYGVWSMEYGVWSMEYGVWRMACATSYSATPDAADERNAPHGATFVGAIGRDGGKKYTRHMTPRQSTTDNTTADRGRGDSETEQRLEHEPSSDHDMGNPE
jgi:hypothetical protein